jgi:hypothetical protein
MQFLKRFLSIGGNVVPQPPSKQPVPQVTSVDVERIVERDFKYEFTTVMALLNELVTARVQLAALKLANGSVEKLRSNIESAKRDYRDIIAFAEYPEYHKKGFRVSELSADEQTQIIKSDWRQYEGWLRK